MKSPSPQAGFTSVLRIPGARQLIFGSVVGRMPIGMFNLAGLLLVNEYYSSFALAGLTVAATSIGTVVAAPLQGALVDRHGMARVLIPVALGQVAATGTLTAGSLARVPFGAILILALISGALMPPLSATLRTTWMHMLDAGPSRDAAFALDAMTTQLLFALGPLITAAVVSLYSSAAAVVASGVVTFLGTITFVTAAPVRAAGRAQAPPPEADRPSGRVAAMLATLNPELRLVLCAILLVGWASGSQEVGLPALAVQIDSAALSGLLVGLWCLGGVAGGWFYGRRAWSASIIRRHQLACVGAIVVSLPLMLAASPPAGLALSFVSGLPWAAVFACQYQMVASHAPARAVTEAFTWSISALIAGDAIGASLGGAMASAIGPWSCFVQTAAVLAGVVAWDGLMIRRSAGAQPATALERTTAG